MTESRNHKQKDLKTWKEDRIKSQRAELLGLEVAISERFI